MVQPILPQLPGKAASMGRNFCGIPWESVWLQEKEQGQGKAVPESRQTCRMQVCLRDPWGSCAKDKGLSQGESLDGRESIEDSQGYRRCHWNRAKANRPEWSSHTQDADLLMARLPGGSVGKEPTYYESTSLLFLENKATHRQSQLISLISTLESCGKWSIRTKEERD